jgi:molybdopterin-guanine dinucleotide biosynthesis protein A
MAGIKQEEKFFFCPCNFPFISLWYLYYLQFQIKSKKLFSLYFNPLFRENKEKVAWKPWEEKKSSWFDIFSYKKLVVIGVNEFYLTREVK